MEIRRILSLMACVAMIAAVFAVAVPMNVNAAPTYVWVDDDFDPSTPGWGVDHFDKIQNGVDAVDVGGTVYVHIGIYYEPVTITKSLTLQGEDKDTTIIDGSSIGDVVSITTDWVSVSGFNITNSGSAGVSDFDSGVDIRSNHNNIENCIFYDNNFGIYLRASDHNTISNTNCFSNQEYGIFLHSGCDYNTITDCNVYSNLNNGIYLWIGLIHNTVSNNNIYDNMGNGITVYGWGKSWESYHYFSNNLIFHNSERGISLGRNCNNNTVSDNSISDNGFRGLSLFDSDNNTVSNNSLSDNGDIGLALLYSNNNNIYQNNIIHNGYYGLSLYNSNDNNIYHNNIIDNTDQVYDNGANIWDNGAGEGNYWSDYEGEDLNDDGIGDTNLPHLEVDWYPLMDPWGLDEEIEEIIEDVEEMDLPQGIEDSLLSVLEAALNSIDTGNEVAAIQQLQAFIRMVEAMRGNKLTEEEANALIAAAQAIIDDLTG